MLTGGRALGVKHAGHIGCGNKVPLGNLIRTITEKMGLRVDDRFYGGAHTGVIKELKVKVGDVVLYSKYGGTEVKYAGEEYLVLSARDVLAVIDK